VNPWVLALHGDLKTFLVGVVPYTWIEPEQDPAAQGTADARLKLEVAHGPWRFDAHHAVSVVQGGQALGLAGDVTGVALTAPEFVDLTWEPDVGDELVIRGRTDRLMFSIEAPHLTVTAGRQPISFGTGLVFTPMDIVNPFLGATIDTEYKPGIDALRADVFGGVSARASVVAAWVGPLPIHDPDVDPGFDDLMLATSGGFTVGTTDIIGLLAYARSEPVVGAGFTGSIGPAGVHGEATLTVPADDALEDDPFVRALLGGDVRPTTTTTLSAEVYVQTFGAADPSDYLEALTSPRFARGEVWTAGRWYAAVMAAQEITPLVDGSIAVIGNLQDPSAVVAPGFSWSVANEAVVTAGMYAGVGKRPDTISLAESLDPELLADSIQSEFGLYPIAAYLQMSAYF
jgi:hypothetical protein